MIVLPIPLFVAIVLGVLALRVAYSGRGHLLAALLATCALQGLLAALILHYGVSQLKWAQPIFASTIPPLAWATFTGAALRPLNRNDLRHALGPLITVACILVQPYALDLWVPGLYAAYGGAILWRLRAGQDLPLARIEAGPLPLVVWRALGLALIASTLSDLAITAAILTGNAHWHGTIISVVSSSILLLVGLLSIAPAAAPADEIPATQPKSTPQPQAEDAQLVADLERVLTETQLYLDPNLSLSRLARRAGHPEKTLSAAINRQTGENVSRYVNGWRIRHACGLLEAGSNATEAMLASGFNTKSNFNREFTRVTGVTPSKWRQSQP